MKFLTYNLSWEGQDGKDTAGAKGSKCVVGGVNKCRENVMKVIADGDYDYILLQETSFGEPFVIDLPGYIVRSVKKGAETIATIHRAGTAALLAFAGELSETEAGRPFLVLIFEKLIVINLHAPHSWSVPKIFSRLETAFKSKKVESMLDRPIVIGGDFNMDVGKTMTGFCRKFTSEPVHAKTCCDANFGEGGEAAYFGSFDHFLISPSLKFHLAGTVKDGKDNVLHSDHLPLYAVIGPKKTGKGRTRRNSRVGGAAPSEFEVHANVLKHFTDRFRAAKSLKLRPTEAELNAYADAAVYMRDLLRTVVPPVTDPELKAALKASKDAWTESQALLKEVDKLPPAHTAAAAGRTRRRTSRAVRPFT